MNYRSPNRSGGATLVLVLLLVVAGAIGAVVFAQVNGQDDSDKTILLHTVARSDFEAFVTEPGDVASSNDIEIKCKVKSRGAAGTAILTIVDEGTLVLPGDVLVEFDDSLLKQELLAQEIVVANDEALLIQAKSDLEKANETLIEFDEGIYLQEVEVLEGEVFVAEEELQRSEAALAHGERLAARSFITRSQLKANQFAVEKARKDVSAARRKLDVYKRFTRKKLHGEYSAEVKKQTAYLISATKTLELSNAKRDEIKLQIDNCKVRAPAAGQVVHANERDRGNASQVIEEGTVIRQNQVVIRLPDLTKMKVDVKINESHINRVKLKQDALIELDADPDNVLHGTVVAIKPYPFPMRWHGAPLEYGVEVEIIDPPPTLRPGLRAKVKIVFERQPNVLQVPLASVIEHHDRHFCLVRKERSWRPQRVKIGANSNNQVIVLNGLSEGDSIALTPFEHIERADLPDTPQELAGD